MRGHGSALKRSVDIGKVMGNADSYHYVNEPIWEVYSLQSHSYSGKVKAMQTIEHLDIVRDFGGRKNEYQNHRILRAVKLFCTML